MREGECMLEILRGGGGRGGGESSRRGKGGEGALAVCQTPRGADRSCDGEAAGLGHAGRGGSRHKPPPLKPPCGRAILGFWSERRTHRYPPPRPPAHPPTPTHPLPLRT